MTDRELMQMALDALDLVTDLTSYDDEVYEAIDALRDRLAQPEPDDGYCQACEGNYCTAKDGCVALDNSRAQPEQEPQGGYRWREGDVPPSITYTTPPQREWQGLKDEEITETLKRFGLGERAALARAIEAKLKEKNGF